MDLCTTMIFIHIPKHKTTIYVKRDSKHNSNNNTAFIVADK